jgi:hypothetical protein
MPLTCHQRFIKVGKSERGMWNNNSWPCHKNFKVDFLEHDIMVTLCVVYPQFWARIQMMHSKIFTFTLVSWRPPFVSFTRWASLTNLYMITHNSHFWFAMFFFSWWPWCIMLIGSSYDYDLHLITRLWCKHFPSTILNLLIFQNTWI